MGVARHRTEQETQLETETVSGKNGNTVRQSVGSLCSLIPSQSRGWSPSSRSSSSDVLGTMTHLTIGSLLQALLCFIHKVFFLKIQITLELYQSLENQKRKKKKAY